MNTIKKIELLRKLFVNRDDTFAVQWKTDEGSWRYWRVAEGKGEDRKIIPLDDQAIANHLKFKKSVGVYAMDELDRCKWICLDVDIKKGFEPTPENVQKVKEVTMMVRQAIANHTDKIPMIVEFSGRRGFHIWIFSEKMPAEMSRAIGMYFAGLVVPPVGIGIEVYPKSAFVDEVGSLVKMPMGIHQETKHENVLVTDTLKRDQSPWETLEAIKPWPMQWWKLFMEQNDIAEIADLRQERKNHSGERGLPCITNMFETGVEEGQRDEAAFVLSNFLVQKGVPDDIALVALEEWNLRNLPPLKSSTLQTKINSAIRNNYSIYPCQREAIDPYCDPNCKFYPNKMKSRGLA